MSKIRNGNAEVDERRRRGRADAPGTEQGNRAGRHRAEASAIRPLEPGEVSVEGVGRTVRPEQQGVGHAHVDDRGVRLGGPLPGDRLERHGDVDAAVAGLGELEQEPSSWIGELRCPRQQVVAHVEAEQLSGDRVKRRSQGLVDAVADQRQAAGQLLVATPSGGDLTDWRTIGPSAGVLASSRQWHRRQPALGDELPRRSQDQAGVLRPELLAQHVVGDLQRVGNRGSRSIRRRSGSWP